MKKLFLSLAALMLPFLPVLSQEVEEEQGALAEVTFMPRFDFNLSSSGGSGGLSFDHGNSSFYSLLEGSFSENVSFTISNHWLSTPFDNTWLYDGIGRSDTTNWLDFFSVDFNFGNWDVVLGKDCLFFGGFEFDPWDAEVNSSIVSSAWNSLPVYQWGGYLSYTTPSEMTNIAIQAMTSPYGEHPFSSGLFSYGARWTGCYGPFSNKWSFSALQYDRGQFRPVVTLAQNVAIGDWTFGVDWYNVVGDTSEEAEDFLLDGHTVMASLAWSPSEKWTLEARYIFEGIKTDNGLEKYHMPALNALFTPNDSVKLSAFAKYDTAFSTFSAGLGVLLYLRTGNIFRD